MKVQQKWMLAGLGVCVLSGLAFLAGRAWAGGIPATSALSYAGTLEDSAGAPKTGDHAIEVKLWDVASGGTASLCTSGAQTITLDNGRFSLGLPDACTDAVKNNPDVYAEVLVDSTSLGRAKAGAVPFAVEAGHAQEATHAGSADSATSATNATNATNATTATRLGSLAESDVQKRVTGTCGVGSFVRTIQPDGSVTCGLVTDSLVTVVKTTASISSGSFGVVNLHCPADHPKAISGGIDLQNVLTMAVTSSAPTISSVRLQGTADGTYPAADGWQASARNDSSTTYNFTLSVTCSL